MDGRPCSCDNSTLKTTERENTVMMTQKQANEMLGKTDTIAPSQVFNEALRNSITLYHGKFIRIDIQASLGVERDKQVKVMNMTWGKFSPNSEPQLYMQIQDCKDGEIRWVRFADVLDIKRI